MAVYWLICESEVDGIWAMQQGWLVDPGLRRKGLSAKRYEAALCPTILSQLTTETSTVRQSISIYRANDLHPAPHLCHCFYTTEVASVRKMAWGSGKSPASLTSELLKASRLGNIQGGLPPILKAAPAIAIVAGVVVSKATGANTNFMEERMLGATDGVIALAEPEGSIRREAHGAQVASAAYSRAGVSMMCARCQGLGLRSEVVGGYETWRATPMMNGMKCMAVPRDYGTSGTAGDWPA
ncbi:hypothetical protein LIA77_06413 [Sarocladium implicatum]|nr:hypothetical protein LIA77_06413 [Sarocladium implicatum]